MKHPFAQTLWYLRAAKCCLDLGGTAALKKALPDADETLLYGFIQDVCLVIEDCEYLASCEDIRANKLL